MNNKFLRPTVFLKPPQNFITEAEVVSCYCIWKNTILLLQRQTGKSYAGLWGAPAGKKNKEESVEDAMTRELFEETAIKLQPITFVQRLFVQLPEKQFLYHLFTLLLEQKPIIRLNKEEHVEYEWCPIANYLEKALVPGEVEAFKIVSHAICDTKFNTSSNNTRF